MRTKIRADIETRALLSRGSTDIYADICNVYVSNSMSFSTVCRQVGDFSAGVGSVTSAPKYCRSKSASSPKFVIKNYIVKSDAKIYFSADCGHGWHFKSICTALLAKFLKMKRRKALGGPHICSMRSKNTRMLGRRALLKGFQRYDQKLFMNVVTYDESWMHYFEPHRKIRN